MKILPQSSPSFFMIITALFFFIAIGCTSNTIKEDISLSAQFPDHNIDYDQSMDNIQAQFDKEMWETFIALCWPSDGLSPSPSGSILDKKDGRPVFENYSFNYDLFLLNIRDTTTNFKPIGWGQTDSLNMQRQKRWEKDCPDLLVQAKDRKITNLASIIPLDEFIQASNGAKPHVPVIDQNSNYVWSGVVFNKTTFDFTTERKLYSLDGINEAKQTFITKDIYQVKKNKETNTYEYDTIRNQKYNQLSDDNGSMHLKTSWKILGGDDDTTKFHKAWAALLFNNVNFADANTVAPQCTLVQVGLVGMHISYKTEDQPAFIWATFEHVDNCPEKGDIEDKHYSFFNYDDQDTNNINKVPMANENVNNGSVHYGNPKWFNPFTDTINGPSQVVRLDPITKQTQELNTAYQKALAETVWSNYELVATQWTHPDTEKYYPKRLYNTTLETFEQEGSSCIGCHHQVLPNTLKGGPNNDQFFMKPDTIGNVLNLPLNLFSDHSINPDTAVYSDYMWSLLKWSENGHLTWRQIAER